MPAKAFIDTNIWLYSLIQTSENDARHQKAARFLDRINRPVISAQVIHEASSNLIKKTRITEENLRALISGWYQDCEVSQPSESQLLLASSLRESNSLSYWDSLIIAAALDSGCSELYSEDMQHGRVINGKLVIQNPFVLI